MPNLTDVVVIFPDAYVLQRSHHAPIVHIHKQGWAIIMMIAALAVNYLWVPNHTNPAWGRPVMMIIVGRTPLNITEALDILAHCPRLQYLMALRAPTTAMQGLN
mmetsp:Transcript_3888/g.10415  ORF Transcript_3888/g.10415 Transcript_3888/m.10415 type:complete len:104 (+) Transcript_3888:608-919(+)